MIVTCPNCGANYRLADDLLAGGTRMRCAECDHRWAPAAPPALPIAPQSVEDDEETELAEVQAAIRLRAAALPAAPDPDPASAPEAAGALPADMEADDDGAPPESPPRVLQTVVAVIAGLALAVVAAGLWIDPGDVARLPVVGPALARLDAASPLKVTAAGTVTLLPSGRRVLEVTGTIANPGREVAAVGALAATLAGPGGVAVRWTVQPPVAQLAPGQQVAFTTTATGFPEDARQLSVTPGR